MVQHTTGILTSWLNSLLTALGRSLTKIPSSLKILHLFLRRSSYQHRVCLFDGPKNVGRYMGPRFFATGFHRIGVPSRILMWTSPRRFEPIRTCGGSTVLDRQSWNQHLNLEWSELLEVSWIIFRLKAPPQLRKPIKFRLTTLTQVKYTIKGSALSLLF